MTVINRKDVIIQLSNVSKIYRTYSSPRYRLMELLSAERKSYHEEKKALDDVSFTLQKGSRLGIVGENGSGKSTLLKVLSGVLTPSIGTVNVQGRISALLELGAGFHPELSGRENIMQFCMLHGMKHEEIEDALPEIIQFSELRNAIEHPVKTYSSGMAVRLGFACAVYVQPDILIVDEALSVGDAYFQNKCLHKIRSMLDDGVTFIYVTHAADAIRSLCDQGLWMENGQIRMQGTSAAVGAAYQQQIFKRLVKAGFSEKINVTELSTTDSANTLQLPEKTSLIDIARAQAFADRVEPLRTGSGEAVITDIVLYDSEGNATDSVGFREPSVLRVFFTIKNAVSVDTSLNVGLTDYSGRQICHFSSLVRGIDLATLNVGEPYVMDFSYTSSLCPNEYGIIAGISTMTKHPARHGQMLVESVLDYCVGGGRFNVRFPDEICNEDLWGVVALDYSSTLWVAN
ncbi:ABC transporter ATP-binding protein [Moraxellaceae bacterium AER2_44_116]|nr:ABC transporter ATP-binding protein [Moraxellaceae bacterium]TQC98946.1 ABC transporter ATP-binding protein [Moraxellaceae bacterium AER2_44_116]